MKSITLKEFSEELDLEVVIESSDFKVKTITSKEVNRPGLQLTGYLEGFPYKSLQLIGQVEYDYSMSMDKETLYERFRSILSYPMPAIIFTHDKDIDDRILDMARYFNKTVMRSELSATKLIANITDVLDYYLAEEITIHADLMEVYGMGVLITGDSSVGKSETALDLVTRGHRLVADDVVDITKVDNNLTGSSPENIRHFLEIRGIGILDIERLYGAGSVKPSTTIDLEIVLEHWDEEKEYDRLGLDDDYTEILGVEIPSLTVPVKPGRNVAMIMEVAVRNFRQKELGYNAAEELNRRLIEELTNKNS